MNRAAFALTLALLAGATGCTPPPVDDAGDPAFVHQAVQTLLGRKPRGGAEVRALNSILVAYGVDGRAAVIDVLMQEPEYVDYWTHVIVDGMQIQRSGQYAQLQGCTDQPMWMVDGVGEPCGPACIVEARALADHLRDQSPSVPSFDGDSDGTPDDFNLHDAVRAAIVVDDLHVAWRPYLVALASDHQAATGQEIRDNYMTTAFGVQTECVGCHASSYSKTEVYDYAYEGNTWDRTSTTGLDLEVATFGTAGVLDTSAAVNCGTDGASLFERNCSGCHDADGAAPLDWADGSPKVLTRRVPLLSDAAIVNQILYGNALMPAQSDLDCDGSTLDDVDDAVVIRNFLREQLGGYEDFSRYLSENQFSSAADDCAVPAQANQPDCNQLGSFVLPFGLSAQCGFGWAPDVVASAGNLRAFAGVARSVTDVEDVLDSVQAGLETVRAEAWAVGLRADGALPLPGDANSAPAALLARGVADDVLEELMGQRTRLVHGLARSDDQNHAAAQLADWMMVEDLATGVTSLSLHNALKQMLLSDYYNRESPSDPSANDASAYEIPALLNPWAATSVGAQDTTTGENLNGQGDLVHRRSPDQLLWSLHSDLGWPEPTIDPGNNVFPSRQFMSQIGRYESAAKPGTTVWSFDSLLLWEEEVGACNNQSASRDYVALLARAGDLGALSCPGGCTVRHLALALKDRLIQQPTFAVDEEALVRTLMEGAPGGPGVGSFTGLAAPFSEAQLDAALRAYCGALLVSPDYLMAGIPTVTAAPAALSFNVCLGSELAASQCRENQLFTHYQATAIALGY
jgi:mono/diheme cytochrome c family protein